MNENLVVSPPPEDLRPDEFVFYCSQTGEIYRGFENYFNRILLLKSCVWQCTATGRQGLTYQEALERELASSASLKNFPETLIRPVLFIVGLTNRSTLNAVANDVYSFVSDHYFIGEEVEYTGARGRRKCGVIKSMEWSPQKAEYFGEYTFNDIIVAQNQAGNEEWMGSLRYGIKPYEECRDANNEEQTLPGRAIVHVDAPLVIGRKVPFSRRQCRNILKICCELSEGAWVVQESTVESYNIGGTEWKDLFNGPLPVFSANPLKNNGSDDDYSSECSVIGNRDEEVEMEEDYDEADGSEVYVVDQEAERSRQMLSTLINDARELNIELSEDLEKRIANGERVTDADCTLVRAMIRKAKTERKESDRLRRRQDREQLLEWRKSRDDLLCDDHKALPHFSSVSLPDGIGADRFGDCMSLLEFVHSYSDMLNEKDFFPDGFSLTQLYVALIDQRPTGTFAHLMCMLLQRIFALQTEEDGDEEDVARIEDAAGGLENSEIVNRFYSSYVDYATKMSEQTRDIHGMSARYLPLNGYTLTEVLRVYFTVSGYFTGTKNAKFRYLSRGGFKCIDDQAFQFALAHRDFVERLKTESLYDFSPNDRLDMLIVLRDQLLTFSAFRVRVDRNLERIRTLRVEMRHLCGLDSRLEKEAAAARYRISNNAKERLNANDAPSKETEAPVDKRKLEATRKLQRLVAKALQDPSYSPETAVTMIKDSARPFLSSVLFDRLEIAEIDLVRELQRRYSHDCCQAMVEELFELMGKCGLLTGRDRAFRRYWFCRSVRALLIEDYDPVVGSCCEATSLDRVLSDQENADDEHRMRSELLVCSGRKDDCPVHGADHQRPRWTLASNADQFDQLIKRLNPRGVREMDLIEFCNLFRSQIDHMLQSPDPTLTNPPIMDAAQFDLSEDSVEQRLKSRFEEVAQRLRDSRMTCFDEEDGTDESTVKLEPTGDFDERRGRDESHCQGWRLYIENPVISEITIPAEEENGEEVIQKVYRLEKWKLSLSTATTYSAVLLHLATLESSIVWQRSLSQMRCRVCRRKGCTATFAFCSECERPFHLTCLKPPLDRVPGPSWICKLCAEASGMSDAQTGKDKSPTGEASKSAQDGQPAEMSDLPEAYPTCSVCSVEVTYRKQLIACSSCTANFHTKCASVKKSEVNVAAWKCAQCSAVPADEHTKEDLKVSRSGRVLKRPKSIAFGGFTSHNGSTNSEEGCHSSGNDSDGMIVTRRRSNGTEQSADERSVTERCNSLLSLLNSHVDSWPFKTPVSKKIAPDYYKVIRSPMDLSTVLKKFEAGQYDCFGDLSSDIELIFNNCYLYNESSAEVYGCGERLQHFFCQQLSSLHLTAADPLTPSKRRKTSSIRF
uniref:Bromodomain adjacent to zinc finger domain protein 1A n=1 Tax=Trichuris muris TaxID=70415 RepID=A0A5S6R244_TRIMR